MTAFALVAPRCRHETADDAAFRFQLFRETHGAVLARLPPALAETLLRQQMAGQAASYAARYPRARHEIIERDGTPVGRIVTDHATSGVTLVDIALLAASRGQGLGTRLIRDLLREAELAGVAMHLSVAHGNLAQSLYARLGFVVVATSETHDRMRRDPGA